MTDALMNLCNSCERHERPERMWSDSDVFLLGSGGLNVSDVTLCLYKGNRTAYYTVCIGKMKTYIVLFILTACNLKRNSCINSDNNNKNNYNFIYLFI